MQFIKVMLFQLSRITGLAAADGMKQEVFAGLEDHKFLIKRVFWRVDKLKRMKL